MALLHGLVSAGEGEGLALHPHTPPAHELHGEAGVTVQGCEVPCKIRTRFQEIFY